MLSGAVLLKGLVAAFPSGTDVLLSLYEFALVTGVALIVSKFWNEKLNRIVNLIIAPILIVVGIRFLATAFA